MNVLKQFLNDSETFSSFTFKGNYNMPYDVFMKIFDVYLSENVNLLDAYSDFIYMKWWNIMDAKCIKTDEECDEITTSLVSLIRHNVVDLCEVEEQLKKVEILYNRFKKLMASKK